MIDENLVAWLKTEECATLYKKTDGLTAAQIVQHYYRETPTLDNISRHKRDLGETMRYAGYMVRQLGGEDRVRVYQKGITGKKQVLGWFMTIVHKSGPGGWKAYGRIYHEDLEALRAAAKVLVRPGFRINIFKNDVVTKDRYIPFEVIGE